MMFYPKGFNHGFIRQNPADVNNKDFYQHFIYSVSRFGDKTLLLFFLMKINEILHLKTRVAW